MCHMKKMQVQDKEQPIEDKQNNPPLNKIFWLKSLDTASLNQPKLQVQE